MANLKTKFTSKFQNYLSESLEKLCNTSMGNLINCGKGQSKGCPCMLPYVVTMIRPNVINYKFLSRLVVWSSRKGPTSNDDSRRPSFQRHRHTRAALLTSGLDADAPTSFRSASTTTTTGQTVSAKFEFR